MYCAYCIRGYGIESPYESMTGPAVQLQELHGLGYDEAILDPVEVVHALLIGGVANQGQHRGLQNCSLCSCCSQVDVHSHHVLNHIDERVKQITNAHHDLLLMQEHFVMCIAKSTISFSLHTAHGRAYCSCLQSLTAVSRSRGGLVVQNLLNLLQDLRRNLV